MKRKVFVLVLCLLLAAVLAAPVSAYTEQSVDFPTEGQVIDAAGLLTTEQEAVLESAANALTTQYQCGVYVVSLDDYTQYGNPISDAVINLYHDNRLGAGSGRDGILLIMDPYYREFAFFVYGDQAEYIFDDYGQLMLEGVFLDDFADDRWYDGFEDFVSECGYYMETAAQGNPVRESKAGYYGAVLIGSPIIALVVCLILLSQMKSVARQTEASAYVTSRGLRLEAKEDRFTHMTQMTRDLSSDDDSGGGSSSFSGGGGSGRSGRF